MQRSHSQPYHTCSQQTDGVRHPPAHSTSSAFSASANPNEDWTKISDLAERRRIQNRIAQRNYRKKLKRRLEDLERKATSTSPSPELRNAELVTAIPQEDSMARSQSLPMARPSSRTSRASSTVSYDHQTSPDLFPLEDPFSNVLTGDQQFQFLSPPTHAYSNGAPCSDYVDAGFSYDTFTPMPQIYADTNFHYDFADSLGPTLPRVNHEEAMKRNPYSLNDELLNPFGISYATLVGMEVPTQYMNTKSPPSTDSWSSNYSRENSPPNFVVPTTPLSRSTSPNVHLFEQNWQ